MKEIWQTKSDARILFTSGYTAELISSRNALDGTIDLLMKPINPAEFAA